MTVLSLVFSSPVAANGQSSQISEINVVNTVETKKNTNGLFTPYVDKEHL